MGHVTMELAQVEELEVEGVAIVTGLLELSSAEVKLILFFRELGLKTLLILL